MTEETDAVLAAGIIVYRMVEGNPHFLLLENALHGTWGFPKGHRNGEEDLVATARRETEEETGLRNLELRDRFRRNVSYEYPARGRNEKVLKEVHYFLARLQPGTEARISGEHSRVLWLDRTEARKTLQYDILRELLDCAFGRIAAIEGFDHPDPPAARALLEELSEPDMAWRLHSLETGRVAGKIARGVAAHSPSRPIDPCWVEAAGLLHDIGRSRSHGMAHPIEGFRLLEARGLGHLAKPCVSHWLKGRSRGALEKNPDFSRGLLEELDSSVDLGCFTLSEKIVALSDSLVQHDRVVTIEERYREARDRYGQSRWMADNEQISLALFAEVDALSGRGLERLLGIER